MAALVVALASALVVWNCWRQIDSDRACSERLRAAAASIDAMRARLGHQPSERELGGTELGSVMPYKRWVDAPGKLLPLGAQGDDDYSFAQWRGEQFAYYYSWSGEDTCESGAWTLLLALGLPLACVSVLLLRLSRRQRTHAPS